MRHSKTKTIAAAAIAAVLGPVGASCSSDGSDNGAGSTTTAAVFEDVTATTDAALPPTTVTTTTRIVPGTVFVVVPFTAANGTGTITITGDDSPIVNWFLSQPGEIALDLFDADINDAGSVVGELISVWFFRDENSGEVPPSFAVLDDGAITDILGTSYVVESQPLPPAPGPETTTTTTSAATISTTTTSTTSSVPGTSETPTAAATTTTTTAAAAPATTTSTTTTTTAAPAVLQVQVLNGSGVTGAAGRLTEKISRAGFVVLPAGNAPQRYATSAVYYQEGWQAEAEEILQTADIEEIEEPTAMPRQFAGDAAVIVLLGTDTAPAVAAEQAELRPRPDFSVKLPLGDDVPRDRYVPGLANIQIYTAENENDPQVQPRLVRLSDWIRGISHHANEDIVFGIFPEDRSTREGYLNLMREIETELEWLGFTPQNVCGAPAGYSFTELLQPTREWSESRKIYGGDSIFTTDRLIELHGGERINPEDNLDFYIREAVQTAHDILRSVELLDETEAPQLILCEAWISPAGELPEFANAVWYSLLTPGTQPQESLLSQGTYHFHEIERDGNFARLFVCHPPLTPAAVSLSWREAGYRAEVVNDYTGMGCQEAFESLGYAGDYEPMNTIQYGFGEVAFSASGLLEFPRAAN